MRSMDMHLGRVCPRRRRRLFYNHSASAKPAVACPAVELITLTLTLAAHVKVKLFDDNFNDGFNFMADLSASYEPSTDAEFFMLMRELLGTRFDDFHTVNAYVDHLGDSNSKIISTEVELTLERRALLTLTMTLLPQYDALVQVWITQSEPLTFDAACAAINEHKRRYNDADELQRRPVCAVRHDDEASIAHHGETYNANVTSDSAAAMRQRTSAFQF
ncbi:hypothetical protein NX059_012297 [Plenodomus lindquistii]|nr:hypothetical protein NX059_012297 [Plenodomus lindquistii]